MVFTSLTYVGFLTIAALLYWILRVRRAQNILLLVLSYVFYGWLSPWICLLLAGSTIVTHGCMLLLWRQPTAPRSRWPVALSIAANIGMLIAFKYEHALPVGTLSIALPIGLSFYALQAVGLSIDAYRGDVQRQSFLSTALFLAFFPKLIAGPLEKASGFLAQINQPRSLSKDAVCDSCHLLIVGFAKKMVIAENIRPYVDQIFTSQDGSPLLLLAGTIGFAVQIFADFSGYTDIARGSAGLLGFSLQENFDQPYRSVSPADFWRRWHMSLSHWIRDYVYIPLGGSRHSAVRTAVALLVSMMVSGAWHGAQWNYVVWGAYWGVLLLAYRFAGIDAHWQPKTMIGSAAARMAMACFILIGWAMFRDTSFAWMAHMGGLDLSIERITPALQMLCIAALYAIPLLIVHWIQWKPVPFFLRSAGYAALLLCILSLSPKVASDFIYMGF